MSNTMNNVMIDIETLGTKPDSPVLAIGAVFFDPDTGEIGNTFYRVISLESALIKSKNVDADTLKWWMQQSKKARDIFLDEGVHRIQAFNDFRGYMVQGCECLDTVKVWANGASFDPVILEEFWDTSIREDMPWKYYNIRCFRTMKAYLPKVSIPDVGVAHNALSDAMWQARYLIEAMRKANENNTTNDNSNPSPWWMFWK